MLTHCSKDEPEEPAFAARSACLTQAEVKFFAFDGAFGAGAGVLVTLAKRAIPGNEGVHAVVFLGIGVDDPVIERIRTILAKVRAGSQRGSLFGGGQGTAPLEAQTVRAKARTVHRLFGQADGDTFFETQGSCVFQVALVALVE